MSGAKRGALRALVANDRLQLTGFCALGIAISYALLGQLIGTELAIVDDHWIIRWVGTDGTLHASELLSTLWNTEVGDFGHSARFRPVYFSWLILETSLFGANAAPFFVVRIVIFGLFLGAIGWAVLRIAPLPVALIAVGWVAGLGFWGEVWGLSFGVAEQVATAGLALVVVGFTLILQDRGRGSDLVGLHLAGLGVTIAAGSKENFAFLAAPYALAAVSLLVFRRVSLRAGALAVIYMVIPALVLFALASIGTHAADIYGSATAPEARLTGVLANPLATIAVTLAATGVLVALLCRALAPSERRLTWVAIGGIWAAIWLTWELYFYAGKLPSSGRYDLPGVLLPAIALTMIATAAVGVVRYTGIARRFAIPEPAVAAALLVIAMIGVGFLAPRPDVTATAFREEIAKSVERRLAMKTDLAAMKQAVANHPDWPIVLEANSPWDYEPIDTARVWFTHAGIANPLMVLVNVRDLETRSELERTLVREMTIWSEKGSPDRLVPLAISTEAKDAAQCFTVVLWNDVRATPCEQLSYRPRRYIPQ